MTADELKRRTFDFGLRAIRLVGSLPRTTEARAIGSQLVRSGTSVGANYRAACKARSKAEFVAKLGIVEEEADESGYWLELIVASGMMKEGRVHPLLQESQELCRIIGASRVTAQRTQRRLQGSRNSSMGNGK